MNSICLPVQNCWPTYHAARGGCSSYENSQNENFISIAERKKKQKLKNIVIRFDLQCKHCV